MIKPIKKGKQHANIECYFVCLEKREIALKREWKKWKNCENMEIIEI